MTVSTRSTSKKKGNTSDGDIKKEKKNKNINNTNVLEPPVPFILRIGIICMTSYAAHLIWNNRHFVFKDMYQKNQTPTVTMMIQAFEFLNAMGFIFLAGIFISNFTKTIYFRIVPPATS